MIGGGKIVAQGAKHELLAARGHDRPRRCDPPALQRRWPGRPHRHARRRRRLLVEAQAEEVGRVAADAGLVLLELRPADTGGLERLFLSLTREEALVVMTALTQPIPRAGPAAPDRASSCARWPTPAPASGCCS